MAEEVKYALAVARGAASERPDSDTGTSTRGSSSETSKADTSATTEVTTSKILGRGEIVITSPITNCRGSYLSNSKGC